MSFDEIVDTFKIRSHEDTHRYVHRYSPEYLIYAEDRYFYAYTKCFRIRGFAKGKPLNALVIRRATNMFDRAVLSFNYSAPFVSAPVRYYGRITIHNELDIRRAFRNQGYATTTDRTRLHYTVTITKLLPRPYATKCHDYTSDGYASREDCIDQCVHRLFLETPYHVLHPWSLLKTLIAKNNLSKMYKICTRAIIYFSVTNSVSRNFNHVYYQL